MRRPYRERFRLLVTELGTGLAGRVTKNDVIGYIDTALQGAH